MADTSPPNASQGPISQQAADSVTLGEQLGSATVGLTAEDPIVSETGRPVISYRGGRKLSSTEAMTHLAYLLRLENVGVLLGAGASVGARGMTMQGLWRHFTSEISESEKSFLVKHKIIKKKYFPIQSRSSVTASKTINTDTDEANTASGAAPDKPHQTPDIEALLDKLAVALAYLERIGDEQYNDGRAIQNKLYTSLVAASKLDADWWKTPSGPDISVSELQDHREMLQKISSIRQPGQPSPWIFTTNYDLAIEWAADSIDLSVINGFIGIHSRKFTPQSFDLGYRNVQTRGEARFGTYNIYLAKLHGSLTWKQYSDGQFYEVQATEAWNRIHDFCDGRIDKIPFTVAPSAAKYVQTVGFLYGELMRRFAEFIGRSQTVLFISGYSFGDEHINRLLLSALLNPTLQVVIYIYELEDERDKWPQLVKDLTNTRSSRITIIGGSFADFVSDIPDPAIYNSDMKEIRNLLGRDGDES